MTFVFIRRPVSAAPPIISVVFFAAMSTTVSAVFLLAVTRTRQASHEGTRQIAVGGFVLAVAVIVVVDGVVLAALPDDKWWALKLGVVVTVLLLYRMWTQRK